jgi:hypothetical protein
MLTARTGSLTAMDFNTRAIPVRIRRNFIGDAIAPCPIGNHRNARCRFGIRCPGKPFDIARRGHCRDVHAIGAHHPGASVVTIAVGRIGAARSMTDRSSGF